MLPWSSGQQQHRVRHQARVCDPHALPKKAVRRIENAAHESEHSCPPLLCRYSPCLYPSSLPSSCRLRTPPSAACALQERIPGCHECWAQAMVRRRHLQGRSLACVRAMQEIASERQRANHQPAWWRFVVYACIAGFCCGEERSQCCASQGPNAKACCPPSRYRGAFKGHETGCMTHCLWGGRQVPVGDTTGPCARQIFNSQVSQGRR